ncbi:DUF3500 domain-containing protein [Nocardioides flavescens]|uniref:DUF3500 domain-containing protein n=1 Tax=Nocardioides flavescens TaxID=2691959 RepID=UPI0019260AFA
MSTGVGDAGTGGERPSYEDPETIQKLLVGAIGILDTFDAEQRRAAVLDFDDPARLDWDIIPRPDRTGVSLHQLDRHQKVAVLEMVRLATSYEVFTKVLAIMQLEHVLRARETDFLGFAAPLWRTSDSYFFTVFGRPGFEDTWSFRFLGHHVCLNVTVVEQRWLSTTPSALGQQPVNDPGVLDPLRDDEGLAFALLDALEPAQADAALVHAVAPADFVTRQVPRVGAVEYPDTYDLGMPQYQIGTADREALAWRRDAPGGLCAAEMTDDQRALLSDLVAVYLARCPDRLAAEYAAELEAEGPERLFFAWAGVRDRTDAHYFRITSGRLLIETVNAVDHGDHLHSVLRDLDQDFAHDLLGAAAERSAREGSHLDTRTTSSEVTGLRHVDGAW